jgi:hypothetical protein
MVILFDAYMQYPDIVEIVNNDLDLITFFRNITIFVSERLSPLREEIDLEEAEEDGKEDKNKATIIWVLPENKNQITFVGYSEKLKKRMLSCFSKEDMDFFINQQSEFTKMRNN